MVELIMGFDFGTSKIGIAVGQKITASASPISVVKAKDGKPNWSQLDKVIGEWQPCLFVVGLPLNMDDSENVMTKAAVRFAKRLNQLCKRLGKGLNHGLSVPARSPSSVSAYGACRNTSTTPC